MSRFAPAPRALRLTAALLLTAAVAAPAARAQTTRPRAAAAGDASLVSLARDNAVFVYVDFLSGLDDYLTTVPGPQFRNNVTAFAKLNPIFRLPTAVLGDESEYAGRFYPEIRQHVTVDTAYFRRTTPTGYTPAFASWLRRTGRRNVIIGGISVDNCTLHTTLDLLRAGYNVFVVLDVSSTNNKLAEDAAIARMTRAGAVPTTWIAVATELLKDWNSPTGQQLMQVMQAHLAKSTVGTPVDPSGDLR
jgi:nicotinamidase-related amidase